MTSFASQSGLRPAMRTLVDVWDVNTSIHHDDSHRVRIGVHYYINSKSPVVLAQFLAITWTKRRIGTICHFRPELVMAWNDQALRQEITMEEENDHDQWNRGVE